MTDGRAIRVYDYVNQPFARVRQALLQDTKGIVHRATTVAHDRASQLVASLHVNIGGIEIGKAIDVQVLGSSDSEAHPGRPSETRIELQWAAVGSAALFPTMKAELVLYPLSATETQLDLHGTYEPPLGPLGAVLDVVLGHRVAEASIHRFIADLAERLRRELT